MSALQPPSVLPTPSHSSPPLSPTLTQVSDKSPTPSPPEDDELLLHAGRASHRPSGPDRPWLRVTSPSVRPGEATNGDKEPVQRPVVIPSLSAPPGHLPRLVPRDYSQYTEPFIPDAAVVSTSTTLAELAHLVRLQKYQKEKRASTRSRLHRYLVAKAVSKRLIYSAEHAGRALVDSFRSDDKTSFARLYNALHDVRNSCDSIRRYALLEPDMGTRGSIPTSGKAKRIYSSFLDGLPRDVKDDLLGLICKIRTNPDFLAERISGLSPLELASLTTSHHVSDPIDSVMPLTGRPKNQASGPNRRSSQVPSPVERLLSFQRHDPFSFLIHTVFADSSGADSAEDLRRTDVLSTTCAKLIIEGTSGGEQFMRVVLNSWAAMRKWSAKSNLESYLMKVLQDGAFLLERAPEKSSEIRQQVESRGAKDTIASDDFFDGAVKGLFEVIDDDSYYGGIPEGVIEIGSAILQKLEDTKKHRAAQTFIVSKWFFSTFLLNVIIHPESHGIMVGHHISEYARLKVLKEIAIRAQKHVWDMTFNWKQSAPVLPELRVHIENILARFRKPRSRCAVPLVLRTKEVTSPQQTAEVQPYLMVSPSDIVTIVNSLFPERRPSSSSFERSIHERGLRSAASSLSGVYAPSKSIPFSTVPQDNGSILSQSSSSLASDTTSREPLLDTMTQSSDGTSSFTSFGSRETLQNYQKTAGSEEYGNRLRSAVAVMTQKQGSRTCAGSCHPCAESWALLYVSADGLKLTTRLARDLEDSTDDEDDDSADNESDEDGHASEHDLERDYHQLKAAIIKLVEEYEVPKEFTPEVESKKFSNLAFTARKGSSRPKGGPMHSQAIVVKTSSNNPYHSQSQLSQMLSSRNQSTKEHQEPHDQSSRPKKPDARLPKSRPADLLIMLEAAINQCEGDGDYITAHLYWRTVQHLHRLSSSSSLVSDGYGALLNYFGRGVRDSLIKAAGAIEQSEAWFVWLKQAQDRHDVVVQEMMACFKELRDKMWYITDVKNSAAYEECKNVAIALRTMAQPSRTSHAKAQTQPRGRSLTKPSTHNFLVKTETQVIDLMTASSDQGGPNKLSDEQSEMTNKWLTQYSIENFCKGEERIHRFCLEIDRCISKLIGNDILDGPVLWSSELYCRDKKSLERGWQNGDLLTKGFGELSVASEVEDEAEATRSEMKGFDFIGYSSPRDLRSISSRNVSQQSFDSSKWNTGRGGGYGDIMDSHDVFGLGGSLPSIDCSTTFWSPFQTSSRPKAGASSIGPRRSIGVGEIKATAASEGGTSPKGRFLLDLKQTLTGLLLSDLGNMLWSRGSETDSWFSGEFSEVCMQRNDPKERRRKKAAAKVKGPKSSRATKAEKTTSSNLSQGREDRTLTGAARGSPAINSTEENSSSSDTTTRPLRPLSTRASLSREFPYQRAFVRLLSHFSTHSNPFAKLDALFELERLIVAYLSPRAGIPSVGGQSSAFTDAPSPKLGSLGHLSLHKTREPTAGPRARNLEEAIASCSARRSSSMLASSLTAYNHGSESSNHKSMAVPPSTDMIVEVMQGLFRDAEVRPRTLFRDLQYIASFVPFAILDKTERGKAFWDAGLAALGLKQDVCRTMVEIADDVVAYNTKHRSLSPTIRAGNEHTKSSDEVSPPRFSMRDAAQMWSITAKEGDPVAQRELAICYLTNPDLLARTTLPLSRPKEVFKGVSLERARGGDDTSRSDPATMCVAYHWMELSSQGGDDLARQYLRAREELNALP